MDFFYNGNIYKKYFYVEYDKKYFKCYVQTNQSNQFIVDTYDNNCSQFNVKEHEFNKYQRTTQNSNNKIAFRYNNYNIVGLNVQGNNISKIVFEQLKHLQLLNIAQNQIKILVVQNNPILYSLVAFYNQIQTIDLSKNYQLSYLDLSYNIIKSIDLTNNGKLRTVDLSHNEISNHLTIELTQENGINQNLIPFSNNINSNIKLNTNIKRLDLSYNNLTELVIPCGSQLNFLNISHNPQLKCLHLFGTHIRKIISDDVNNEFHIINHYIS